MKRFVLVLFASLVLPSVASADSFSATFAGTGRGAGVSGMVNGSAFSVWAGEIKWTSDSFLDDFTSFCVQLDSHLNSTQVFEAPADLGHISAYKEGQIAFLVGNAVSSNWMAAGLQLAIWNVIYDDDFTVSAGLFTSSTAGAADSANTFLRSTCRREATVWQRDLPRLNPSGRSERSGPGHIGPGARHASAPRCWHCGAGRPAPDAPRQLTVSRLPQ